MARTKGQRHQRTCTNNCSRCDGDVLSRPKCSLGTHVGHCLCLEHALEASRSTPMPDPAPTLSAAEIAASRRESPAPWCPDCLGSGKTGIISELVRPRGDAPSCQRCQGRGTLGPMLMEDINGNVSVGNIPSHNVVMGTNDADRVVGGITSALADLFVNSRRMDPGLRVGRRFAPPSIDDRIRARDEQLATGRAPQATTWRTQDGREIPIATMEDTHLHNTIRYLERKVAEARAPALMRLATDRARAEEIKRLATVAFSSYAALTAEAKRRELGPTLGTDMADLEDKIAAEQAAASETDAAARMRLVAEELGQKPKKPKKDE